MSRGTLSSDDPGLYGQPHSRPRFQFITVSDPSSSTDAATKILIRKHVTREIGRAKRLANRKRKSLIIPLIMPSQDDSKPGEGSATDHHQKLRNRSYESDIVGDSLCHIGHVYSFRSTPRTESKGNKCFSPLSPTEALNGQLSWLGAGPLDPFTKYPFEIDRSDQALVAHIFHDPDGSQHAFRDAWYSVGLSDPAAFHLVLSNSAAHLNSARLSSGRSQSAEEMLHYNSALRSVNDRIQNPVQSISDGVIGAITGFICHNHIKANYDQWHIHRKGLVSMINLRGGIGAVDKNNELRLTIMWVDLSGAYAQDIAPQYPFPYHLSQGLVLPDDPSYIVRAERSPLYKHCGRLQVDLTELMGSLSLMDDEIKYLRTQRRRQYLHVSMPNGDWTNSIVHKLLTVHHVRTRDPGQPSHNPFIDEACRLGLLLFLAEIRRRCGIHPTRTGVMSEKLAAHLRANSPTFHQIEHPLFLWLLVMGAMEAPPHCDTRFYFLQGIRLVMDALCAEGWEAVLHILRGVLWSDEVYATRGESAYMAVHAMSE